MDDLISRRAVIDALEKVARFFPYRVPGNRDTYDRYNEAWNDAIGRAEIEIEELPSAQPQPKEGEWSDGYRWQRCSLCKQTGKKSWNYCPHCGADMRGEKDG